MRALPVASVTLDGEVVICEAEGVSQFDRMRAENGAPVAFLYAFDLLELDGQDLRGERWDARRAQLGDVLDGRADGVRLCEHIQDIFGAMVFRCVMRLEGIVAKRRDRPYRSGRSRDWINREHQIWGSGVRAIKSGIYRKDESLKNRPRDHQETSQKSLLRSL
jgi:bifunctional non-homologous end joining protein LigD